MAPRCGKVSEASRKGLVTIAQRRQVSLLLVCLVRRVCQFTFIAYARMNTWIALENSPPQAPKNSQKSDSPNSDFLGVLGVEAKSLLGGGVRINASRQALGHMT